MKKLTYFLIYLITCTLSANLFAADPVMVKDINPNGSSNARVFLPFGDYMIFEADDGTHGIEKWMSDGTESGTFMLKDINPDGNGGASYPDGGGYDGAILNNEYYFNGNNGDDGYELWKTDGTESGTVMVKDINRGRNSSAPNVVHWYSTIYNNQLIFSANKGRDMDREPFKTDGTESGTVIIKDICTTLWKIGFSKIRGSLPGPFVTLGDYFYFEAYTVEYGKDLMYRSDATESGTTIFLDNNQQMINIYGRFEKIDDILYFAVLEDGEYNPWRSNGTSSGTYRLASTESPSVSGAPCLFTKCGSQIYFSAADGTSGVELWKTDGSEAGTEMVAEINPTSDPSIKNNFKNKAVMNDIFYFQGDDGTNGWELWRSNGTETGTYMVKDINPNGVGLPRLFVVFGNTLYFVANDGDGVELWESDGTTAGTIKVSNINANGDASVGNLILFDNILYFTADDGTHGAELWKYDPDAVDDDTPPTAICQDLTVYLDASGSITIATSDIDNGSYDETGGSGLGNMSLSQTDFDCTDAGNTIEVTLTVYDNSGNSSTCTANVTVQDNTAPTAIGKDITINLDVNGTVTITADDVDDGSYDNCSFTKSLDQYTFTSVNTYTVTLTADDGTNTASTNDVTVTVEAYQSDSEPPTISVSLSPTTLSPVNQRMNSISASVSVSDNNPGVSYVLTSITSNQNDSGLFRKDKADDIQNATLNTADTDFDLRAENYLATRVYTVTYTATDAADNTATAVATVTAPFSGKIAIYNEIDNSYINIYPNPVEDNLTISMEMLEMREVEIRIIDILGIERYKTAKVMTKNINQSIDTRNLVAGIYYIEIRVDSYNIHRKFIKQ